MFVFARRIERALDVAVQRSHDADAGEHRWPCSATSNSASIAACHSSASCFAFGSLVMYRAASRNVQQRLLSARQYDRIEKPLIPRHELHLPLIGGANEEYGTGSKHF
jgi:hypothetical protein